MPVENIPLLDKIKVAAPCQMNWNEMVGGEQARYCRACEKSVYNLSEMSREEAEKLLRLHEGKLCVRYYRRSDGTIMTSNCPVGLRVIRRVFLKQTAAVVSLCGVVFGAVVSFARRPESAMPPVARVEMPVTQEPTMGDITAPPVPLPPERGFMGGAVAMPKDWHDKEAASTPGQGTPQNAHRPRR